MEMYNVAPQSRKILQTFVWCEARTYSCRWFLFGNDTSLITALG